MRIKEFKELDVDGKLNSIYLLLKKINGMEKKVVRTDPFKDIPKHKSKPE